MDILNFISWIKGRRQFTTVNPSQTVLPVGIKDPKRDDEYLTGAITVDNFAQTVAPYVPAGAQGPIGPQGVPGPVGPAGLTWQGAWVSGTSYVVDDAVGYDGASWFCIAPTSGTTAPDSDPTHWALLAAQGATGPQGPQGIQGPAGAPGLAVAGTYAKIMYHNGVNWAASTDFTYNGLSGTSAKVGIGSGFDGSYQLKLTSSGAAFRINGLAGYVANIMSSGTVNHQWGINSSGPDPALSNAVYFTNVGTHHIKFATNNINRFFVQGNGQVTVGQALATNPEAKFVVKEKDIEVEEWGRGVILASPDGNRFRVTVDNLGNLTTTAV